MNLFSHIVIFLIIVTVMLTGCGIPHIYSSEAIYGWVVDVETNEPVEGVVVMISWSLEGGWHTDHTGYLVIEETLTDENGYYKFDAWGPKFTFDALRMSEPTISFIKLGYIPRAVSNKAVAPYNRPKTEFSEWTNRTIGINAYDEKLEGGLKVYARKLSGFASMLRLSSGRDKLRCAWEGVPQFSAEIIKFNRFFTNKGIYSALPDMNRFTRKECNDVHAVLGKYL